MPRNRKMQTILKPVSRAVGAVLLVLLGTMTTTSPKIATSNVGGWLSWFGVDRVPGFLASAAADRIIQLLLTVVVTATLTTWWHRRLSRDGQAQTAKRDADRLDDSELGDRMEALSADIRQLQEDRWYGRGENVSDVMVAIESLRITLAKQKFSIPFVPMGSEADEVLEMYDRYFTIVGKLLREGHAAEARDWARQLAERNPPPSEALAQSAG